MNKKYEVFEKEMSPKKVKLLKFTLLGLLLLIFCGISFFGSLLNSSRGEIDLMSNDSNLHTSDLVSTSSYVSDTEKEEKLPIYIIGEVNSPGIYFIEGSAFLYEIVEMANGLTEYAAKDSINLVYLITENKTIKIPNKDEITIEDNEFFKDILIGDDQSNSSEILVNINTANQTMLETLPGIGPSTAGAIIDHREKKGKFNIIEDIMLVTGIKENKFNLIKDKITVR